MKVFFLTFSLVSISFVSNANDAEVDVKLKEMSKILREAKVKKAVDADGKALGFKFKMKKRDQNLNNDMLNKLSFKAGRSLTTVEGGTVTSPAEAMRLYKDMINSKEEN